MSWSWKGFVEKSKAYGQRAFELKESDPLFAFWLILSLELLVRASLAKKHPALLSDSSHASLLHGCGIETEAEPKSVHMLGALERCVVVVPGFTSGDKDKCAYWFSRRNAELHSSDRVFDELDFKNHILDFLRIAQTLCSFLKLDLKSLFGTSAGRQVEGKLKASIRAAQKNAQQDIATSKKGFVKLSMKDAKARERDAKKYTRGILTASNTKAVNCPSCGKRAILGGEQSGVSGVRKLVDGRHYRTHSYTPEILKCFVCDLELSGAASLQEAGLNKPFTHRVYLPSKASVKRDAVPPMIGDLLPLSVTAKTLREVPRSSIAALDASSGGMFADVMRLGEALSHLAGRSKFLDILVKVKELDDCLRPARLAFDFETALGRSLETTRRLEEAAGMFAGLDNAAIRALVEQQDLMRLAGLGLKVNPSKRVRAEKSEAEEEESHTSDEDDGAGE